jgi:hypothetical protein
MWRVAVAAAAALATLVVLAQEPEVCGPQPPPPTSEESWTEGDVVLVPDWVPAPAPACWVVGRAPLTYPRHSVPLLPNDMSPGPWIEGLDYPMDAPCPA